MNNARGNRALEKLGAVREGLLRQCFECGGQRRDYVMWSILMDDWNRRNAGRAQCVDGIPVSGGAVAPPLAPHAGRSHAALPAVK